MRPERKIEPFVRWRAAFSLTKLLVAIGIIALLIGILFPVVSSARRRARDIQCASNMRQIFIANLRNAN